MCTNNTGVHMHTRRHHIRFTHQHTQNFIAKICTHTYRFFLNRRRPPGDSASQNLLHDAQHVSTLQSPSSQTHPGGALDVSPTSNEHKDAGSAYNARGYGSDAKLPPHAGSTPYQHTVTPGATPTQVSHVPDSIGEHNVRSRMKPLQSPQPHPSAAESFPQLNPTDTNAPRGSPDEHRLHQMEMYLRSLEAEVSELMLNSPEHERSSPSALVRGFVWKELGEIEMRMTRRSIFPMSLCA